MRGDSRVSENAAVYFQQPGRTLLIGKRIENNRQSKTNYHFYIEYVFKKVFLMHQYIRTGESHFVEK